VEQVLDGRQIATPYRADDVPVLVQGADVAPKPCEREMMGHALEGRRSDG